MNVGFRSQSLYCIHQSTVEFDASTIGVDPGLFSDAIIELGASSVSVKDRAFGTEEETPIFRHHSQSRLWRGGRGKGQDPALVLAKGEQEGRSGRIKEQEDEELWKPSEYWEKSVVTASFPSSWDLESVAEMLQLTLGLDSPPGFTITGDGTNEAQIDWVKKVQESWDPIVIGQDLVIAFPWHEDDYVASLTSSKAQHKITLEGGVAFGTGEHPTTRLCIEWLQAVLRDEQSPAGSKLRVLDYGSGSGILGLVAVALGALEVVGVEVDRDAIAAAHRNGNENGISRKLFRCHLPPDAIATTEAGGVYVFGNAIAAAAEPDCTPLPANTAQFDLAVANILAGPLTQLAPTIASLVRDPGGKLALSGVLTSQETGVLDAYRPFFPDVAVAQERDGWLLITGTRGVK